jgi:hypothetical protein
MGEIKRVQLPIRKTSRMEIIAIQTPRGTNKP